MSSLNEIELLVGIEYIEETAPIFIQKTECLNEKTALTNKVVSFEEQPLALTNTVVHINSIHA